MAEGALRTAPLIARLLLSSHIEKNAAGPQDSHCWIWDGSVNKGGYGVIGLEGGRGAGTALTHRVSYEHFVGSIPDDMTIDHLCEVKRCIRPGHLEVVTRAENTRRKYIRNGRCRQGHVMDEANTYRRPGSTGTRCRACASEYQRDYRAPTR